LHNEGSSTNSGTLYVVATPIGNLRDITLRALDTLKSVQFVAAEDTRQTRKLLAHYDIAARMIAVHEHNERKAGEQICKLLAAGNGVALVTDAGTPALSDPGARVVRQARAQGFAVTPIPGASALTAALSVAGIAGEHMLFAGFLPVKAGERSRSLESLAEQNAMLVFFEAPHRIAGTLSALAQALGAMRRVVIARELTKMFEQVHVCLLGEALAWLEERPERRRGEFVLIVAPPEQVVPGEQQSDQLLRTLLVELPVKQAVRLAAAITGGKKNALYQRALSIKGGREAARATQAP
jgi:16S rRNA (cytidine1402-2'-O)-methyltransferase